MKAVITLAVTVQHEHEEALHAIARRMRDEAANTIESNAGAYAPRGVALDVSTSRESDFERREREAAATLAAAPLDQPLNDDERAALATLAPVDPRD